MVYYLLQTHLKFALLNEPFSSTTVSIRATALKILSGKYFFVTIRLRREFTLPVSLKSL